MAWRLPCFACRAVPRTDHPSPSPSFFLPCGSWGFVLRAEAAPGCSGPCDTRRGGSCPIFQPRRRTRCVPLPQPCCASPIPLPALISPGSGGAAASPHSSGLTSSGPGCIAVATAGLCVLLRLAGDPGCQGGPHRDGLQWEKLCSISRRKVAARSGECLWDAVAELVPVLRMAWGWRHRKEPQWTHWCEPVGNGSFLGKTGMRWGWLPGEGVMSSGTMWERAHVPAVPVLRCL